MGRTADRSATLLEFLVALGAAMNTAGQPVYVVQDRLSNVARAYGAHDATISAFPTYLMMTIGRGEPATVELTTTLSGSPRLDQIAALDRLIEQAENGDVTPEQGLRLLDEIREMQPRFSSILGVLGYALVA
ncbi:MAG TPA: threonine/serine exporter family protein, partial [Acidimicrobiia bacterium]|nr:threonine/serine exporter family protein [Acidimicrobiia bacterium]